MADLESRVDKIETRVTSLEVTVEKLSQKVDDFITESRESHKRHDDDMREFREKHDNDMREFREKHDNDMREIRQSISDMGKHSRNLTIAVIIGIAAMVIAVLLK